MSIYQDWLSQANKQDWSPSLANHPLTTHEENQALIQSCKWLHQGNEPHTAARMDKIPIQCGLCLNHFYPVRSC